MQSSLLSQVSSRIPIQEHAKGCYCTNQLLYILRSMPLSLQLIQAEANSTMADEFPLVSASKNI